MGTLMKDESYFKLYDTLNKGINDYSCSDFMGKAEMLFNKLEEINKFINDRLSLVWKDQVQTEIEEKTSSLLTKSVLDAKSYVDDVISPLVGGNHVENLKNKLKEYIDAYNIHNKTYGNVVLDEEEYEKNKPQIPDVADFVGGANNTYYQQAYKNYEDYVSNFEKQKEAIEKSEKNVKDKHAECGKLITEINKILTNTSGEATSVDKSAVSAASSTKSDNGLEKEVKETIDENGNKHVTTTMRDANGNIINENYTITDKDGNEVVSGIRTFYENGKVKTDEFTGVDVSDNSVVTNGKKTYSENGTIISSTFEKRYKSGNFEFQEEKFDESGNYTGASVKYGNGDIENYKVEKIYDSNNKLIIDCESIRDKNNRETRKNSTWYDDKGNVESKTSQLFYEDGTNAAITRYFDENGNITKDRKMRTYKDSPIVSCVVTTEYNDDGKPTIENIEHVYPDGKKETGYGNYEYDENGNELKYYSKIGEDDVIYRTAKYNESGKITSQTEACTKIGGYTSTMSYKFEYDENGKQIAGTFVNDNYRGDGKKYEVTYRYDENGNKIVTDTIIDKDGQIKSTEENINGSFVGLVKTPRILVYD